MLAAICNIVSCISLHCHSWCSHLYGSILQLLHISSYLQHPLHILQAFHIHNWWNIFHENILQIHHAHSYLQYFLLHIFQALRIQNYCNISIETFFNSFIFTTLCSIFSCSSFHIHSWCSNLHGNIRQLLHLRSYFQHLLLRILSKLFVFTTGAATSMAIFFNFVMFAAMCSILCHSSQVLHSYISLQHLLLQHSLGSSYFQMICYVSQSKNYRSVSVTSP